MIADKMKRVVAILTMGVALLARSVCLSQDTGGNQDEFKKHFANAIGFLRDHHPDLAIPEFQAAVQINPRDVDAQGNLGVLLFFQNRYADAVPHLRIAIAGQPDLAKQRGLLGIAEIRTQDFENAINDLTAAFPQTTDKKFKVQLGLELVQLLTATGDLEKAASVIAQLREVDPANTEVLYAAYRTYTDLASGSMMALAIASPDSAQMHQLLAHEEIREGNTNGALADFRKALALNPRLPGGHYELAELLNSSDDVHLREESVEEYKAALAVNPQDEKAICRLGAFAAEHGDTARAYSEYSHALELQPADTDAKLGLAKALVEMNQSEKALPLLEQTVKFEPGNAVAHYRLSTLYRESGRKDDAKHEMELFLQYKKLHEKLRATYQVLLRQPDQIREQKEENEK
jgi:tetratricopeptide (TPR) repeat protein